MGKGEAALSTKDVTGVAEAEMGDPDAEAPRERQNSRLRWIRTNGSLSHILEVAYSLVR